MTERDQEDEDWMNVPMGKPSEPPALVPVQLGAIYSHALLMARATARTHGYALAVHGSQMRDLDLIAVPWIEEASAPDVLVEAIRKAVSGTYSAGSQAGNDIITKQPHGRLTWAIHLEGVDRGLKDALVAGKVPFHPYLDLSVMPSAEAALASSRGTSAGRGHPLLFGRGVAQDFGVFPDGGGYPIGFMEHAYEWLGVTNPDLVLHLCSGSMTRGVRVDIRPEMNPDVVCDARSTPFPDESFDWIMIDPPYSEEYARNLYGTEKHYPKPGQLMKEACRLLKPGGRVGFLHFQVPMTRRPLRVVEVRGITTGLGYAIRAFTICEKVGSNGLVAERSTGEEGKQG